MFSKSNLIYMSFMGPADNNVNWSWLNVNTYKEEKKKKKKTRHSKCFTRSPNIAS